MDTKWLVLLVIGLIVLLMITIQGKRTADAAQLMRDKEICKRALEASSIANFDGINAQELFEGKNPSDVPCRMQTVEINGDSERIKKDLAGYLYQSWDMMHRGELELFSGIEGEETYCIPLYLVKFHPDTKAIRSLTASEFTDHLSTTLIPPNKRGLNMTYFQYLQGYNTYDDPDAIIDFAADIPVIDMSTDYLIMFKYAKKGYLGRAFKAWKWFKVGSSAGTVAGLVAAPLTGGGSLVVMMMGAGSGIVTGVAAGAVGHATGSDKSADWEARIFLVPNKAEFISNLHCTYFPGELGLRQKNINSKSDK